MRIKFSLVVLIFSLLFFEVTSASFAEGEIRILMTKDEFSPKEIEIQKGQTVIFENKDGVAHWPASNIHPTHQIYPEFDPKAPVSPNSSWSFKFGKVGEWRFHDHLYPERTGVVKVKGEENQKEIRSNSAPSKLSTWESFKLSLLRFYFKLFPKKLDEFLSNVNIFNILKNQENQQDAAYWVTLLGPRKSLEKLLADSGQGSELDCHPEAHTLGRVSYEIFGSNVFGQGSSICHAGFYHGAMEAFLKDRGTGNLARDINKICTQFKTGYSFFECLHGVGHGVIAYVDYDLPKALETCNLLDTDFGKSSCYGGVFMENIVTGEGRGALVGHKTNWISADPNFPCNAIDQSLNVQTQCYMMQTSRMLDIFVYDFGKVIAECLDTPKEMVAICYQSLGRDAAGQTLRNTQKIVDICLKTPKEYYSRCIEGGLNVIVDFWGEKMKDQAYELCRDIYDGTVKRFCYQHLGYRLIDIYGKDTKKIAASCEFAEDGYKEVCKSSVSQAN